MSIFAFNQLFLFEPRNNIKDSIINKLRVVLLMSALSVHVLLACELFIHYRSDHRGSWWTDQSEIRVLEDYWLTSIELNCLPEVREVFLSMLDS